MDSSVCRPANKAKQKPTSKDEKGLRAKRLKSAVQPIQPLSSDLTNRALGPSSHLDLSNLGIIIDQTTENTSLFVDVFKNKGLKLEDTARKSPYVLPTIFHVQGSNALSRIKKFPGSSSSYHHNSAWSIKQVAYLGLSLVLLK
ncbi:unnamed protein product [Alternaria alternata]